MSDDGKGRPFEVLRDVPPPPTTRRLVPVDPDAPPPLPPVLTLAERTRAQGAQGSPLPTGFSTLDASTRGGPRRGNLTVLGGAPGAGKTTLGVQLVRHYLDAGLFVCVLASDEEPFGLISRFGQSFGFSREDLEGPDDTAREELAVCFEERYGRRAILLDAHDGHTVETATEILLTTAAGAPAVLFADSIQTVRALGTDNAESPRQRVDAAVSALKHAARQGALVFATCEVNRGAYRSSDPALRVADLAAFKESGGIEYGAHVAVLLRSVKDEPDLVDVVFAKNRLRGADAVDEFRLRLDRRHAVFSEVGKADESDRETAAQRAQALAQAVVQDAVVATIHRNPGLRTVRAVCAATPRQRNAVVDALALLLETGRVTLTEGGYRVTETGRVPLTEGG